jgi:hypothetical protein
MNQGNQGYSLTKKTEGRKSHDTVSLSAKAVLNIDSNSLSYLNKISCSEDNIYVGSLSNVHSV